MEASIRNVLGDIGNRIGLGNVQLANNNAKNDVLLNNNTNMSKQQLRVTKTSTTTSTLTTKLGTVVQQQQVSSKSTITTTRDELMPVQEEMNADKVELSNSCVMLDESGSNDEDIEIETESDDDDDDDEEIMYSDEDDEEVDEKSDNAYEDVDDDDEVVDIDALDADDPQLCATYVREIYSYLAHLEQKYSVSPDFLDKKSVTGRMRSVLIDWLIQVHMKFQLLQETMYLTVHLIDAYLSRVDVSKMQLQLVGVTAMFLASKYEEMYVPAIDDFVYMTDNTYTKSEIRKMEVSMCKTLDFAFGKPFPLHFLRRYSKAAMADPKQHTLAKYFMELSLHDAEFSSMKPSMLAACSLNLSMQLLNGPKWGKNMEVYSGYKVNDLNEGMTKLANLKLKAMDINYKYRAATNKYGTSKYMRISLLPELSGKLMREIAATKVTSA